MCQILGIPNPLSVAFVEAAQQAGFRLNRDFNDGDQEGFGLYQVTQKEGQRCSAAVGYLYPALERDNFTALPYAHVTHLAFDGNRCVGVHYLHEGKAHEVEAGREVVLCGGAINSPQLLMLSGIGSPEHLNSLDIPVVKALPGVGQNLMEHVQVGVAYACTQEITQVGKDNPAQAIRYQNEKNGIAHFQFGGSWADL